MHRIDGSGATANNRFTDGDPVAGIPATMVTDDFMNDVQEEIMSVLTDRGIAPVKGTQNQLLTAIKALVANLAQATESVRGSAKVATQSQTNSGADDTTFITPKKFSAGLAALIVQATELISGISKIATQTQVNTGTDDATIVTPKKIRYGFAMSFGVNGYVTFPTWLGGLVFQYGFAAASAASSGTVTYPISFPTAARGGFLQNQYTTADSNTFMVRQATLLTNAFSESNLGFNWNTTNTTRTLSFNWFAWGN